jgi:multisubunit Na+/H+ antiporter MnhB subunit
MTTVIFRTASKLIVPVSLVFAVFIFFKGHQTPGGGFVGGLVASVALIVLRMAEGGKALNRLLPFRERGFVALGLTLALGTGFIAMLTGVPFLTSNHGLIDPLPGGVEHVNTFEWATVMGFDAGVFLVVTGVVVGMINALSEELEV